MNKISNILFIADKAKGEKVAFTKIMEMAALNNASVTVMDVMTNYPDTFYGMGNNADLVRMYEHLLQERQEELQKMVRSAGRKAKTVKTGVLLRQGIDYIEIIRQVKLGKHDLVAKASDNSGGLVGALFGSLDMNLLRKCPCPVFVMKPRKKIRHSRILAAVDLNVSSKERMELDHMVVGMAADIAKMEAGTMELIHAWHLAYEKKLRNEERIRSHQSVDVMLKEIRELEKANLEKLAETCGDTVPRTHLFKGAAQDVIPRFVKAHRIDLLVMGSVGRAGVAGFFIGNTAEKILNGLNCSVLAIKPEGFKSPVL